MLCCRTVHLADYVVRDGACSSTCLILKPHVELSACLVCPSSLTVDFTLPPGSQALRHAFFTVPLAEQHGLSCAPDRSVAGWC